MKYFKELKRSMNYLAENKKTVFIGQAVEVPGTAMSDTLKDINDVITEENCNDINNALSISIKKIQELLKLNEKEEYINIVDFNIASKFFNCMICSKMLLKK